MPCEAESDSAVGIDVVTEGCESYESSLWNDWSKITPMPCEALHDSAVGIDVVTEGWEIGHHQDEDWDCYGYVGGVPWLSKINKPLPDLQSIVQEVEESARAAEMQEECQKFFRSGIGFLLRGRWRGHPPEAALV